MHFALEKDRSIYLISNHKYSLWLANNKNFNDTRGIVGEIELTRIFITYIINEM